MVFRWFTLLSGQAPFKRSSLKRQPPVASWNWRQPVFVKKKIIKQKPKNMLNIGWILWHSEEAKQELKNQSWIDPFDRPVNEKYA